MVKCEGVIGNLEVGDDKPVRIMGIINVSPESFYKGSVATSPEDVAKRALSIVDEGRHLIDVGSMSTAPYLNKGFWRHPGY